MDNKPGTVSELLPHVASNFQLPTSNLLSAKCPLRLRFHENIFSPQLLLFCVDFPALVTLICEYIHNCFCKFSGNCELRLSRLLLNIFQCWCWCWKHLHCFCTFSGIGVIVYSVPTPAITLSGTSQQLVLQVTSLFSPSNKSATTNFLFISCTYIYISYFLHITEQLFEFTPFNRDAKN